MASPWIPLQNYILWYFIHTDPHLIGLRAIQSIKGQNQLPEEIYTQSPARPTVVIHSWSVDHMNVGFWNSNASWKKIKPFPYTVWTLEVGSPMRYKSPFFKGSNWSQWRQLSGHLQSLHGVFCSHLLSSLPPRDSCRRRIYIKPHKAMQREVRVRASKVHKNRQFPHSSIYLA